MDIKLIIESDRGVFEPVTAGKIRWTTEKNGAASELFFQVIKEGKLSFNEGHTVILTADGVNLFKGYVFSKSRDKEGIIQVWCYDQLRYFKNKDSYVYSNKKAGELLNMIAEDHNLNVGETADTGYVIPSRIEDGSTLFDIMYTALDITKKYTGRDYVLYDDFGKLVLKDSASLVRNYFVCKENSINFRYISSINNDTYNKVILVHTDKRKGINNVYTKVGDTTDRWGILQYYSHIPEDTDGNSAAEEILKAHNRTGRYLKARCFGDISVRGGVIVPVLLDLGDFVQNCFMSVKKAVHYMSNDEHIMELTLHGGDFTYE